jgi:ryanodine receptor 2
VFNLYQGVRAGGGIGDVIEPADGDDSEVYRILFDISFFFFIIVILLAIIQGMYHNYCFEMSFESPEIKSWVSISSFVSKLYT